MTERNIPAEIVAEYDNIFFAHEGKIYVEKEINGEICSGSINIKGEEISSLRPICSRKGPNAKAELGKNAKWGFRDKNGNLTVSFKYDFMINLDDEILIVKQGIKWAIIDYKDNGITPFIYDYIDAVGSSDREIVIFFMLNKKMGVLDKKGNVVAPPKYDCVHSISEGLIDVSLNNKHGFIDIQGNEVIPLKYDFVLSFSKGLAEVELNNKRIYIDRKGKPFNPHWILGCCSYMLYSPIKFGEKWNFFDIDSRRIISAQDAFESALLANYTKIRSENKEFLINNQGEEISSKYDFIQGFLDDLALVKLNNKYGFIDKQGNEVIPLKYDGAYSFCGGLVKIKLNNKWSLIDKDETSFNPEWCLTKINSFIDTEYPVKIDGKWHIFNQQNREIISCKSSNLFSHGTLTLSVDDKWGLIDDDGNELIPFIFECVLVRFGELLRAYKNNKYGFVDKNGNTVIPLEYDMVYEFHDDFIDVAIGKERFYIDKKGNRISGNSLK